MRRQVGHDVDECDEQYDKNDEYDTDAKYDDDNYDECDDK